MVEGVETHPTPNHRSLYERIGGEQAVENLVEDFYERVLADEELRPFFESVSMGSLRAMQREFFCAALDGPGHFTGRPLSEAHHGRGIESRHVRRFLDHLLDILEEQLDDDEVLEVISRVNRYVGEITGRGEQSG
jgi:hemoglobin